MRFVACILLTSLLALIAGIYLPWWSIALAAFAVAILIHQSPGKAFLAGFTGLFLLWCLMALVIDINNEHLLSQRIAVLLPLGGSSVLLAIVSGFIGGLVGGMSALTAAYARRLR